MVADSLQHIDQIVVGVDLVQPASHDQAVDDAHVLRTDFGPVEQPSFSVMEMFP